MTVAELILKLQKMPQDAVVVVRGYESGYDDVKNIKRCKLKIAEPYAALWGNQETCEPAEWDGVYAQADDGSIDAVYIQGYNDEDKHEIKRGGKNRR